MGNSIENGLFDEIKMLCYLAIMKTNNPYTRISVLFYIAFIMGVIMGACNQRADTTLAGGQKPDTILPEVQYIEPSTETGISLAATVKDVPLAFTNQLFPYDENGNLIGSSLTEQVDQVLKNIEAVLQSAGTNLGGLVRIHLYLKEDSMSDEVLERLRVLLPNGTYPAVTFISGSLARPGVLVSMDAVAVAPQSAVSDRVSFFGGEGVFGPKNRAQLAILAPGRKIFISGQAEMGEDLSEATHNTMRNLFATLAYIGANAEDVVQVKAFINPIEDAKAIEEEIASMFRGRMAPPIVAVEWRQNPGRAEIELIASAPADDSVKETVSYYAPSWMKQATTFSRVVDIHRGGLLFTSGLYGEGREDGEMQARTIFETLSRVLKKAGSDYDHLVKATYYPSTEDGRKGFTNIRPEFYNPNKPPAASLIQVQGAGRQGKSLNVDLIGVVPN